VKGIDPVKIRTAILVAAVAFGIGLLLAVVVGDPFMRLIEGLIP